MSLAVALPCAAMSAVFYGASTAVQHTRAHAGAEREDAADLVRLLRDPRWLLSVGGDVVGLVLQVVALSTGPVVLVQPLLVLAVPVALPVGRLLGGKRPRPSDYLACTAIIAGLSLFLQRRRQPRTREAADGRNRSGERRSRSPAGLRALRRRPGPFTLDPRRRLRRRRRRMVRTGRCVAGRHIRGLASSRLAGPGCNIRVGASGRRGRGRCSSACPDTGLVPGRSPQCQLPSERSGRSDGVRDPWRHGAARAHAHLACGDDFLSSRAGSVGSGHRVAGTCLTCASGARAGRGNTARGPRRQWHLQRLGWADTGSGRGHGRIPPLPAAGVDGRSPSWRTAPEAALAA